jgi:hypothetical protein
MEALAFTNAALQGFCDCCCIWPLYLEVVKGQLNAALSIQDPLDFPQRLLPYCQVLLWWWAPLASQVKLHLDMGIIPNYVVTGLAHNAIWRVLLT